MKNKKILTAVWIVVLTVNLLLIAQTLLTGEYLFAYFIVSVLLTTVYFLVAIAIESNNWNKLKMLRRYLKRGNVHCYVDIDSLVKEPIYNVKALGVDRALQEEKYNAALRIKHDKIMRQQHGHVYHHPARYRHEPFSIEYFLLNEFNISTKNENVPEVYWKLGRLQCSTYAIKMFYRAKGRFPSEIEGQQIANTGFDAWFLNNFIRLLGGEDEKAVYDFANDLHKSNENINPKYKADV